MKGRSGILTSLDFARTGRLLPVALLSLCVGACSPTTRFALRAPVLRDADDRPFAPPPEVDEESDYANTLDVTLFRPLSHFFLFESVPESRNVSSLDEVPDSTWFTNRHVSPADLARGPCPADAPSPPFTIKSSKGSGTTPGFVVKDAKGKKYVVKLDGIPAQPELSTAADAIVSRLYWAAGFNAPCNEVVFVGASDFLVTDKSYMTLKTGGREPLSAAQAAEVLSHATRGPGGALRLSTSLFISGEPVGTFHTEGVRRDDPNDVIPHEDRRELRGERFLAAWVAHWDSRGPNSFDAFVRTRGEQGHVVHYFLDFSDSLGGTTVRTRFPEPRLGHTTVADVPKIGLDLVGLGAVRRPWDEVAVDPRARNLGYLDVAHFDPMEFAPQTPMVRWSRAEPQDLAWMARRLARIGPDHVRAAVRTGKLSNPAEEARLVEILLARREKILRASFARASPLGDPAMTGTDRFCVTDLAVEAGLSRRESVSYALDLRAGSALARSAVAPSLDPSPPSGARLCIALPHFARDATPDDSAERYETLDVVRCEGATRTVLRAHFYDLGPKRGHFLAGVERL